jgi:hypothetical protein
MRCSEEWRGGGRGEEQPAGSGKDRIDCSIPRSGEGSKEGRLVEEKRCGMLGEEVLVLVLALCLLVLVLVLVLVLGGLGFGVSMAGHGR